MESHAYSEDELRKIAFCNSEQQMEILAKLPRLISGSQADEELGALVSQLLLDAISEAEAVAVAHFDETELPVDEAMMDDTKNIPPSGWDGAFSLAHK